MRCSQAAAAVVGLHVCSADNPRRQSAEETLANLLPDAKPEDRHLDLLLMHWPDAMQPGTDNALENKDPSVPILQTW